MKERTSHLAFGSALIFRTSHSNNAGSTTVKRARLTGKGSRSTASVATVSIKMSLSAYTWCIFTSRTCLSCVCVCVCVYIYIYTHTHTHTTVVPTNAHKYFEMCLYTKKPPTCFGQPCDHLQGGKNTKDGHIKEYKMKFQKYKNQFTDKN